MTSRETETKSRRNRGNPETLASTACERLRFDIITCALKPGAKLRIRELCERYGIGLSPMREALNRVSRDGLVRQNDQRGFSVAPLTEQDLIDITQSRCWANEIALRQSIENGDESWEEGLVLAFYRMSRMPGPAEHPNELINPEWERAHRVFHSALISACNSTRLMNFCEQLFDAADRYRFISRRQYRATGRSPHEHRYIMEAAIARDADKAVSLLLSHLRTTQESGLVEMRQAATAPRTEDDVEGRATAIGKPQFDR